METACRITRDGWACEKLLHCLKSIAGGGCPEQVVELQCVSCELEMGADREELLVLRRNHYWFIIQCLVAPAQMPALLVGFAIVCGLDRGTHRYGVPSFAYNR